MMSPPPDDKATAVIWWTPILRSGELNRITQWSLPTEGPKTLNGLIIEFMETIPEPGTSIKLHGHPLEIIKRDKTAVKLVKFLPR